MHYRICTAGENHDDHGSTPTEDTDYDETTHKFGFKDMKSNLSLLLLFYAIRREMSMQSPSPRYYDRVTSLILPKKCRKGDERY